MRVFLIFTLIITLCYDARSQSSTIFFPNDRLEKTAVIPAYDNTPATSKSPTSTVAIDFTNVIAPVSKYMYGHNSNIYMSQIFDQPDLVKHLKALNPGIIRFPGGTISGAYFFNASRPVRPADAPEKILDANGNEVTLNYWFGKNTDANSMTLDNYYKTLETTNTTGIITVNYEYARYSTADNPVASAAHLAAEWVRYDNGRTKFWEIGNEEYGNWQYGYRIKTSTNKDGQPEIITGELYGKHFKVFADSMRKAANEIGATIYIGAMLKEEAPLTWWSNTDRNWNSGIFAQAGASVDYYIVHSYYTAYQTNASASEILNTPATVTKNNHDYVLQQITTAGFGSKPIVLTEWNIFSEGSKQQVSYINGIHAALLLGESIKNKYGMAIRWDLANGWNGGNDHGIFNIGDEPGSIPKWNPRAPFYYMYYFQKYFGDNMVKSTVSGNENAISAYASSFTSGEAGVVLVNKGTSEQTVALSIPNYGYGQRYYYYTLTGGTDNGEFSLKVNVNSFPATYASGGPLNYATIKARGTDVGSGVRITMPARSVAYVLIESGTNVITGVNEEESSAIKVFPNPTRSSFTVTFPEGNSEVSIIDTNGKIVASSPLTLSQTSIQIQSPLSKGTYVVRLQKNGKAAVTKIVIE